VKPNLVDPTRDNLIRCGVIVPHPEIHDQYADGVQVPWLPDRAVLCLDARGKFWAAEDVLETVRVDYKGVPPSMAATRLVYEEAYVELWEVFR